MKRHKVKRSEFKDESTRPKMSKYALRKQKRLG